MDGKEKDGDEDEMWKAYEEDRRRMEEEKNRK